MAISSKFGKVFPIFSQGVIFSPWAFLACLAKGWGLQKVFPTQNLQN